MNKFESIIILNPWIEDDKRFEIVDKMCGMVTDCRINDIGLRKLAYTVKGHEEGYYYAFNFDAEDVDIQELEKFYREEDEIIKFLTIKVDKGVD